MVAYEFYLRDPIRGYQNVGTLPERRKNPERITQKSVMKWGENFFAKTLNINEMIFIQVSIDKNKDRIFQPKSNFVTQFVTQKEI